MPRRKPETGDSSPPSKAKARKTAVASKRSPSSRKKAKEGAGVADSASVAPEPLQGATETGPKRLNGRPTAYKPEFVNIARVMCRNGASDADLAEAFEVTTVTIWRWQAEHADFCNALKIQKGEYDERIKRSLAQRALGYSYDAVKIFMPSGATEPVYAAYREHVPPDPGAAKLWLCNRQPDEWRDRKEFTGKDGVPLVPVLNLTFGDGRGNQSQSAS